ncbi:unnamed protein product [Enterobius vermicularis]|uniref:BPTI/Kunitz inhibitor domain-containing protein n=1 Tax=Enterobius vermicularis TaxID=51028 RepID=A0A0N4UWK5_ENTVE|nr:unnamed protein product [Enterobius vermicularis]
MKLCSFTYFLIYFFTTFDLTSSLDLGGVLCRLPKSEGYECGITGASEAYFYDPDIGECIQFRFLGCGGNQNRFATKDDCQSGCGLLSKCGKGLPLMDFAGNIKRCDAFKMPCPVDYECNGKGLESVCCKKIERICDLAVNSGNPCGAPLIMRYYFDGSSNMCRPFSYTGCGGNENNFKSKGQCLKSCAKAVTCLRGDPLPDRYTSTRLMSCSRNSQCPANYTCTELVCGTAYDETLPCRDPLQDNLWTFNAKEGKCELLLDPACANQMNTFASQDQCAEYCIGSCPGNLQPYLNAITTLPQLCNPKESHSCPVGHECLKSTEFASICCKTQAVCTAAESITEMNLDGSGPRRCTYDIPDTCSSGYVCQQATNLEYICCTQPLDCPFGLKALREQYGRPHICSPGVPGGCPEDHFCVLASTGARRHLCCKPERKCLLPYVNTNTQRPKRCFPGETLCPESSDCLAAIDNVENITSLRDIYFYCCHRVEIFTCSNGEMPVLDIVSNRPIQCNPSDPNSCARRDKVCEKLADGTYSCCPGPESRRQLCNEAVLQNGQVLRCEGWDDNGCSEGACQKAADGRYYCCRT